MIYEETNIKQFRQYMFIWIRSLPSGYWIPSSDLAVLGWNVDVHNFWIDK